MSRVSQLLLAGIIVATWPALGCLNNSGSAQVRLLNASPGAASLNGFMNSSAFAANVAYATASDYVPVVAASPTLVLAIPGATAPLTTRVLSLMSGTFYTVLASGYPASISAILLTDNNSPPPAAKMNLRVINASPSLGTADVYVVAPGTALDTVSPTVSGLTFQSASSYVPLAAGNYEIDFTPTGQTIVLAQTSTLSFSVGEIRTVVGLNGAVTGYTTAVLADLN